MQTVKARPAGVGPSLSARASFALSLIFLCVFLGGLGTPVLLVARRWRAEAAVQRLLQHKVEQMAVALSADGAQADEPAPPAISGPPPAPPTELEAPLTGAVAILPQAAGSVAGPVEVAAPPAAILSTTFTPEVRRWAPEIARWAERYAIDPDLIATVIQIESCGNPLAVSSAGAQGLFQVMPHHFALGENMVDPETNARRALAYLREGLLLTGGDYSLALAGYNGGHGLARLDRSQWPAETRRYYRWGSGIYLEAKAREVAGPIFSEWLAVGGAGLCRQAATGAGNR